MFNLCSATSLRILHVGGFQCEHVEVLFEDVDERAFLFRIEHRPDTNCTATIGDDRILDVLGVEPLQPDGFFSEL
jgi:hypothetical protein